MKASLGRTILHAAAYAGKSGCCSIILRHQPNIINVKDNLGWCPLALSCQAGHIETMRVLLQQGAQVTYTNHGATPLHIASLRNHAKIVEMLVQSFKWDVNIVSIFVEIGSRYIIM